VSVLIQWPAESAEAADDHAGRDDRRAKRQPLDGWPRNWWRAIYSEVCRTRSQVGKELGCTSQDRGTEQRSPGRATFRSSIRQWIIWVERAPALRAARLGEAVEDVAAVEAALVVGFRHTRASYDGSRLEAGGARKQDMKNGDKLRIPPTARGRRCRLHDRRPCHATHHNHCARSEGAGSGRRAANAVRNAILLHIRSMGWSADP
jgi:hypothetical protein